jgi:hypothetical protein
MGAPVQGPVRRNPAGRARWGSAVAASSAAGAGRRHRRRARCIQCGAAVESRPIVTRRAAPAPCHIDRSGGRFTRGVASVKARGSCRPGEQPQPRPPALQDVGGRNVEPPCEYFPCASPKTHRPRVRACGGRGLASRPLGDRPTHPGHRRKVHARGAGRPRTGPHGRGAGPTLRRDTVRRGPAAHPGHPAERRRDGRRHLACARHRDEAVGRGRRLRRGAGQRTARRPARPAAPPLTLPPARVTFGA